MQAKLSVLGRFSLVLACSAKAYTVFYGCFKLCYGIPIVFLASIPRPRFETFVWVAAASQVETWALVFHFSITVDTGEFFARQTHCYFGSRKRQEVSQLFHAMAVSLLCSATNAVLMIGH
ncbi:hypothetical protein Bca4012_067258 [Brassica carinata]|uniref:Uncharacterized protein n=1 Tax=Brassica carinata TaxID=52824 RepID=A0A8X7VRV5_BRACI|nr:hypothetical protein Bca52824_019491 [Brassica carinata]